MEQKGMKSCLLRKSNLEMLRIVAMIMIIGYHLSYHGVINMLSDNAYHIYSLGATINQWAISFWGIGGEVGVALFFMITGYFYVNKDKSSFFKIIVETVFYGVISCSMAIVIKLLGGAIEFDLFNFLKSLFAPVTSGIWWFVSAYVLLMLMIPFINKYIRLLNPKGYILLLCVFWLMEYSFASFVGSFYYELQKAIFFYLIGAFYKLFLMKKEKNNYNRVILVIFFIVWGIGTIICFKSGQYSIYDSNTFQKKAILKILALLKTSIIVPLCAFILFRLFETLNIGYNKWINRIASTTFGVYLLHDSPVLRNYIWHELIKVDTVCFFHFAFPLEMILYIFIVYIMCSIVDFGRMEFVEPFLLMKIKKITSRIKLFG